MTRDFIIQSEPEKQDKNQIAEKKFQNLSNFELKFSNAQGYEKKFHNASDFEIEILQHVRFRIEKNTTR